MNTTLAARTLSSTLAISFALSIAATAACSTSPSTSEASSEAEEATGSALSAPGGDQCATLGDADWADVRRLLEDARDALERDDAVNGVDGAYGPAASYALAPIATSFEALDEMEEFLHGWGSEGDPTSVNYVEGYSVGFYLLRITEQLQYTTHWASISAVYHRSADARIAFETTHQAIELANELRARAVRCYMDAYFAD